MPKLFPARPEPNLPPINVPDVALEDLIDDDLRTPIDPTPPVPDFEFDPDRPNVVIMVDEDSKTIVELSEEAVLLNPDLLANSNFEPLGDREIDLDEYEFVSLDGDSYGTYSELFESQRSADRARTNKQFEREALDLSDSLASTRMGLANQAHALQDQQDLLNFNRREGASRYRDALRFHGQERWRAGIRDSDLQAVLGLRDLGLAGQAAGYNNTLARNALSRRKIDNDLADLAEAEARLPLGALSDLLGGGS